MKLYVDLKNAIKFRQKAFGFLIAFELLVKNCPCYDDKTFQLVINVLANSPKISDQSKIQVFELNLSQNCERIR